jgi:hypothetical protein
MTTVAIVCVHYYAQHRRLTLKKLGAIAQRVQPLATVLVANGTEVHEALRAQPAGFEPPAALLRHDNTGLEFGAYQAGMQQVLKMHDPDWLVIANDTFAAHSNFALGYRRNLVREIGLERDCPAIVGAVYALRRSFALLGLRAHRWVQSNVFALNRAAVQALGARLYDPTVDEMVVASPDPDRFFSEDMDPVLRDHIGSWLFGNRPCANLWYGHEPLSEANCEKMARKARAILHEKYLSARLDAVGAEFVNFRDLGRRDNLVRKIEDTVWSITRR